MFEIKYRIVDDLETLKGIKAPRFNEEWGNISGFFRVSFGSHKEGNYYHENEMENYEMGEELINYWLEVLLEAVLLLSKETDYVALREIDTIDRWIEFRRHRSEVVVNAARDEENVLRDLWISSPQNVFLYIEPLDCVCEWEELKRQVLFKTRQFLKELQNINPELVKTEMAFKLNEGLRNVQDTK